MKFRNGFVSNSSSSSFVVAFPFKPETAEDIRHMLFGGKEFHCSPYGSETYKTEKIAESVFIDFKKATVKAQQESIGCGYFEKYGDTPGHKSSFDETGDLNFPEDSKEINRIWHETDEENKKRAKAIVKQFHQDNKKCCFSVFEYGDDDAWGSMMEHSGIFDNIKYIRTSYH